jgi:dTDP-4-amino-4,6-dideoxygalactose transaminase
VFACVESIDALFFYSSSGNQGVHVVLKIPLSRVHRSEQIDQRILQVVKSGNYILGRECKAFENELAAYFGVKYAVLSSSWTAVVHLLHIALGVKSGDEILVPSLTAFPTIEPIVHAGAKPIFCDIDDTYTLDLADAKRKITGRTIGILPVHLYGRPANIDGVLKLAAEHKLWILEDCAQSFGARWNGPRVGSFGSHAAVSFYPSKNLTVYGDGGAVLTNDSAIAEQITMLRNHGRKDKYLHEKFGFNLRFNEIQAAVGREQLKIVDDLNAARRRVAQWYRRELAGEKAISLPPVDSKETESVYHLFVICLENHDVRESLARHLRENGIETGIHYPVPSHLQPAVVERFGKQPALLRTEDCAKRILSIPMFPSLSEADVVAVCSVIKSFLSRISRAGR